MRGVFSGLLGALLVATVACQSGSETARPPGAPLQPAPGAGRAWGPIVLDVSGQVPGAPGTFVYAGLGGLHLLEPSTKAGRPLTALPSGTVPATPAVAPDGRVLAFSLYRPSGDGRTPGGTDLLVINRDGTGMRTVLGYDAPLASLTDPAWTPDGRTLYYTYRGAGGSMRIERVDLDGSNRRAVVEKASNPSVSPDGTLLAYIRAESGSAVQSVYLSGAGGFEERKIIDGAQFGAIAQPRFSPDGQRLVFVAVGGPGVSAPPQGSRGRGQAMVMALSSGTVKSPAFLHGVPWDVWAARADGTELLRLTELGEDGPSAVWSPDGQWIAFTAELGIYLMKSDGKGLVRLSDEWVAGGMTWLP